MYDKKVRLFVNRLTLIGYLEQVNQDREEHSLLFLRKGEKSMRMEIDVLNHTEVLVVKEDDP